MTDLGGCIDAEATAVQDHLQIGIDEAGTIGAEDAHHLTLDQGAHLMTDMIEGVEGNIATEIIVMMITKETDIAAEEEGLQKE